MPDDPAGGPVGVGDAGQAGRTRTDPRRADGTDGLGAAQGQRGQQFVLVVATRLERRLAWKLGKAMPARIARTATVTISSTMVKPDWRYGDMRLFPSVMPRSLAVPGQAASGTGMNGRSGRRGGCPAPSPHPTTR